jgi:hypothetical protein
MIDFNSPLAVSLVTGALVAVIGAFFAGIVSVVTAWRTVANKVAAIEGHVNSEKTAAIGRESTLRAENILLRELVTEQKLAREQIAKPQLKRPARASDQAPAAAVVESLASIDQNTAKTAANTTPDDEKP